MTLYQARQRAQQTTNKLLRPGTHNLLLMVTRKFSVMIVTLLYIFGSCESHWIKPMTLYQTGQRAQQITNKLIRPRTLKSFLMVTRKFSVMIVTLLYIFGSCESHRSNPWCCIKQDSEPNRLPTSCYSPIHITYC